MSNKVILKYLDETGDYKEVVLNSAEETEIPLGAGDDETWEKELVSIGGVPEVKGDICYKKVRRGPIRVTVPYPCAFTRTSIHKLVLRVSYPRDVEGAVKDAIIQCATEGAIAAAAAAIALFSTPATAAVALEAGLTAFKEKFTDCIGPELISKVSYTIDHDASSGEWQQV
ncbi:hypothetical protein [Bacillus pseudomycoides]|uniref:hypothetical protein n=1 Tax=Bacillus pseudomycoides TaxID=64104 RepID=UPI002B4807B7|nr:hypothetical protein [Bacillus pseudomycoides]MEB3057531.1 hypothetical protein [Bacillus pseudomycoides]